MAWRIPKAYIAKVSTMVFGRRGMNMAESSMTRFGIMADSPRRGSKDVPVVDGPAAAQTVFAYARLLKKRE
jgi:hypothetical protein